MIIYKDIITGDEMFTDALPVTETEDKCFFRVKGKIVTEQAGGIDESLIGGNKSAEDDGALDVDDSGARTGCNIVLQNKLAEAPPFDKNGFKNYFKSYCKAVMAKLKEDEAPQSHIDEFKAVAQTGMKFIMKDIKDYDIYTGESMNPDGAVGFLNYEEDGSTPYMLFFKHGINKEKV